MAAHASGDAKAFRELFRRWGRRVFGFLACGGAGRGLAMDMTQETFMRVHGARLSYDPARPFRPWLFTIAARVQADLAKSWFWRLKLRTVGIFDRLGERPAPIELLGSPKDKSPEILAEKAELAEIMRAQIEALPRAHRTALLLHDLAGLSAREVAEATGKPLGTVLSWIRRGRSSLKRRLEEMGGKAAWL